MQLTETSSRPPKKAICFEACISHRHGNKNAGSHREADEMRKLCGVAVRSEVGGLQQTQKKSKSKTSERVNNIKNCNMQGCPQKNKVDW